MSRAVEKQVQHVTGLRTNSTGNVNPLKVVREASNARLKFHGGSVEVIKDAAATKRRGGVKGVVKTMVEVVDAVRQVNDLDKMCLVVGGEMDQKYFTGYFNRGVKWLTEEAHRDVKEISAGCGIGRSTLFQYAGGQTPPRGKVRAKRAGQLQEFIHKENKKLKRNLKNLMVDSGAIKPTGDLKITGRNYWQCAVEIVDTIED